MTASPSTPQIILSGGSSGGGSAGTSAPGSLAIAYQNLLSGAADLRSGTGSKVLVLTTGNIGMASRVQIGNTETEAEQQANLKILGQIASYCRANNIGVQIDTVLTNPATYSSGINALTDQWAVAAAEVGLPIVAIEDVNEIGACAPPSLFMAYARIEANAVKTLIQDYAQSAIWSVREPLASIPSHNGGKLMAPPLRPQGLLASRSLPRIQACSRLGWPHIPRPFGKTFLPAYRQRQRRTEWL